MPSVLSCLLSTKLPVFFESMSIQIVHNFTCFISLYHGGLVSKHNVSGSYTLKYIVLHNIVFLYFVHIGIIGCFSRTFFVKMLLYPDCVFTNYILAFVYYMTISVVNLLQFLGFCPHQVFGSLTSYKM